MSFFKLLREKNSNMSQNVPGKEPRIGGEGGRFWNVDSGDVIIDLICLFSF